MYFQYQHYFIYRVDDVRITKKEIYFNLNSNHNVANVDTFEIEKKSFSKILDLIYDVIRTEILEEIIFLSMSLFQCKSQTKTATQIF